MLSAEASARSRAGLLAVAERALARGERRLNAGDAPRARALALRVLARDEDHLGALELLGRAALRLGEPEETLRVAGRLLSLNPYDPGYHSLRGLAMRDLGRFAEGAGELSRDPKAHGALGALAYDQERLVAELVRTDDRFARRYAAAPARTLREDGFYVG